MKKLIDDRIEKLRYFMRENNINGYIITLSDFHNSEYPCDFFKGVEYLSGFIGSNGTIFVDSKNCYLWTDGRYFTQCENEIKDTQIKMMKMAVEGEDTLYQIIEKKLNSGDCLAFDGRTVSFNEYKKFEEIAKKKNFRIKTGIDLLDKVWEDRPSLPKEKAYLLDEKFSGESLESKLKRLREKMKEKNATVHILSTLEDIGWLLNLRGNDIEYNPFVLAYAIISMERVLLFTDITKFSTEIKNYFNENNIELFDYFDFYNYLENILLKNKILLDYDNVNCFIVKSINKNIEIINGENPTVSLKAIKNETEIKNTINAHIKDGIAVTKLMYWLKNQKDYSKIKEMDIVKKVEEFRQEQDGYLGNNFSTISAFGKNSPMMHYLPSLDSNATLEEGNFLLLDSGGHYFEGSTDITRTFAIGNVSSEMKKHYTYVLKSLIDLSKLKFPKGTTCGNLDTVARSVIWNLGLDYRCATGHGVGYLGSVHEGPNILRGKSGVILEPNMITTVEPGIYLDGEYGIRLENEILSEKTFKNEYGQYLEFRTITFAPFDRDAIEVEYLDKFEIEWLNKYNEVIFETLKTFLDEKELNWLKKVTDKF
ncbi:MAG: aminopeptidase P family protein [Fusobacterium sp.]|uniref:aminopeptidase P family protein n=1 Tax=Fusobacterium sp. TaxID=68766 RepID=UPI002A75220A|nr:aminopeptidase P family protein [Fusobacterium sp.]MDY2981141.1 aminopeptidase P family protein [Fusobacterium sp.]